MRAYIRRWIWVFVLLAVVCCLAAAAIIVSSNAGRASSGISILQEA